MGLFSRKEQTLAGSTISHILSCIRGLFRLTQEKSYMKLYIVSYIEIKICP